MKKKVKKTSKKKNPNALMHALDELEKSEPEVKKGRPATVDYERFVKLWVGAESVNDVAVEFGIKTTSASAIANRLRKEGVNLKRFPRRGAQTIDVKKLNRIAAGKAS